MAELFSNFYSNELLCAADNPPPPEIRARIEVIVKHFLRSLVASDPSISTMSMISRTAKNTLVRGGSFSETAGIYVSRATSVRNFTSEKGSKRFLRVWKVLEVCYQLLGLRKRAMQREIFYRLLSSSPSLFDVQQQVNDAIQDVVALLQCSRHSLGILASSRGALVGRLLIQNYDPLGLATQMPQLEWDFAGCYLEPNGEIVDCANLGRNAHVITGDISHLEKQTYHSDARYILLVEKDAIFQRLAEDRFFQKVPSIIITGKGYPDFATRVMLHRLHKVFRSLPVVALVDWNPAGLAIICTYKFGSMRMGLEAPTHVCDVKWLGLRSRDLQHVPPESRLNFKERDNIIAKCLLGSKMLQDHEAHRDELNNMLDIGKRAEVEALYAHGYPFLSKFIAQKIVKHDYI